jgi:hypothetical protein
MSTAHAIEYAAVAGLVVFVLFAIGERPTNRDDAMRMLIISMAVGWFVWPFALWIALTSLAATISTKASKPDPTPPGSPPSGSLAAASLHRTPEEWNRLFDTLRAEKAAGRMACLTPFLDEFDKEVSGKD